MLAIRRSPTPRHKTATLRGVAIDFPYLRHPRHLSALIAGPGMIDTLEKIVEWMQTNVGTFEFVDYHDGFYQHEVDGLARLLNVMKAEDQMSKENTVARHDFYLYVQEHDKRNGTNFKEIFPELVEFVDRCQSEYEASLVESNK